VLADGKATELDKAYRIELGEYLLWLEYTLKKTQKRDGN